MKFVAFFLTMAAIAPAQSARVLTRKDAIPIIIPDQAPNNSYVRPVWSGGRLISTVVNNTPQPVLNVVARDGRNEEVRFQSPDWTDFRIVSLWAGEDGEIVVGGTGVNAAGGSSGFIARIAPDRSRTEILAIDSIHIDAMTIGPGRVIWAVGWTKDETGAPVYNMLARVAPNGKLLSITELKGPGKSKYPNSVCHASKLVASSDRVAWMNNNDEYIEFSSDGTELLRLRMPGGSGGAFSTEFAFSFGNTPVIAKSVYATSKERPKCVVWSLDRLKKVWFTSEIADAAMPHETQLYGFDGETLMTSGYDARGKLLVRYTLSETR